MAERTDLKFKDVVDDINSQAGRIIVDPNNPTYEGQQAVQEWLQQHPGYERGDVTNAYLNAQTEPPTQQEEIPQEEMPQDSVLKNWQPEPDLSFGASLTNPPQVNFSKNINQMRMDKAAADTAKAEKWQKAGEALKSFNNDFRNYSTGTENSLQAWNPVASAALNGVDRSGEAAGYAAQAAQNQYNAAQNEKLRQANMQQAMDNTIADKMAAAEAESKWKQNARALREGGAQAVASQNEAVTPDLWKQKQLQNERRDVAAQNLAEVNRNKLMAIGNETNESMTNYATNVENSQNAYKAALANAGGKATDNKTSDNSDNTKTETEAEKPTAPTETTKTTEDSSNKDTTETTETQPEGTTSVAPSNQESEGADTVTDQMKAQQIHDRIEAIYKEVEAAAKNKDAGKLNALATEYDQLVNDFKALPREVQQIGYRQFDPRHIELNNETANYDYSNIIDAVNDRTM